MIKDAPASRETLRHAINLRLSLLGCPPVQNGEAAAWIDLAAPIFARHREITRRLSDRLSPVDERIQRFLESYLADIGPAPQLPVRTFVLDEPGLARALSLPADGDEFSSALLKSYRLRNGVLHNPANDRRTTQGVFHIAEGGLPVPDDKLAVPKAVFSRLLDFALRPSHELLRLPYTAGHTRQAEAMVSLLLRPLVVPAVPGFTGEKRMEIRFFAPGSLVSNLDFVENIFGNAGDPYLPENDAALDVDGWTGHTGCVILAPHLTSVPKHIAGLPPWNLATPRQRRDGMCWKKEDELYNNGSAFKLCARDARGVIVTIIADNYYGYCKKEVKTQISFAANLYGSAEEEHAGGALVFPSYDLSDDFGAYTEPKDYSIADVVTRYSGRFVLQPEGYALDRELPEVVLVPEESLFDLHTQTASWAGADGTPRRLKLLADKAYLRPSGYRVHMEPVRGERGQWRLVGTVADGLFCHKPCTVSGGGKSEISKAISDAILPGHVFVADFDRDFDAVAAILARDLSDRFKDPSRRTSDRRPVLSPQRSLGSVIKLFTPSRREYIDAYNAWLKAIPSHIKELVFVVKCLHKPEWGDDWRRHFSVDLINGRPGNELKFHGRKLVVNTLRIGYDADDSWRVFSLRHDFHPAAKVQMEDDITASVVAPGEKGDVSQKFLQNCEARLFQRPDEAIHRGYDRQAEAEMASPGNFISNYEPLKAADARALVEDAIGFSAFTKPMQRLIGEAAEAGDGASPRYFVSSAHPRLVDGKPSKNPRYLQLRPDVAYPLNTALAELSQRLRRKLPPGAPVLRPVRLVVPGRRNNPPEPGIRPLCVFNPIHHLELPELFMELISSMTGKSPSTTGAGSEGALTKGPFNALPPIIDLNAALVSFILTGHDVFITCAGYVGPKVRVDHDISLLVPEIFSRMLNPERSAANLIADGCLERCTDFEHAGKKVLASRLGYRITTRFMRIYAGRVFTNPHAVFTDEMLRPELQDMDVFADGVDNIVATHRRVAESYFNDGSIELACPPLHALLHIMVHGQHQGLGLEAPAIRTLFTREHLLGSEWYAARLDAKQRVDVALWDRHVKSLERFFDQPFYADVIARLQLKERLAHARAELARVNSATYRASLQGTIGRQLL
ncbi:MAG TPA: hypothetical protein VK717_13130 [Opitutaceae bacterium]|jgi:hypothetical protein|nr:hypothetical protein [Opitutaceae bacterium]